ncbi:MAG: hypothetical protein L6R42_005117 [Xanthoria sp. 1 TBL-2021]|nr:MAG: hypothetical protein L6R42_005117 [Xanthoria sp. 1 TBL-2021]
MDRYGRPPSPGSRRGAQPGRSSTGTLVYPSPFDNYYGPTRSSREFSTTAGPRTSADRVLQPRAVPRYRPESPPSRQSRDDYVVRPRRVTLEPEAAEIRRPLSTIGPSSDNRSSRPVITTSDRPSSPQSKPVRTHPDEPYYLQPASSNRREHRRNYTVGSTDSSRAIIGGRDDGDRRERGGYRSSGIGGGRSGYNLNQPLTRLSDDRDRGGYEYTDRREQMYRDTEPRPRPRRDSYTGATRERPLSMTGLEEYLPRAERPAREAGPPVTMRGFDALGRSGSLRQGPNSRDFDASSDFSRDDYERRKAHVPRVALHQGAGDAYVPSRDDESVYDDTRDRRPRKTVFEDEIVDSKPRDTYSTQHDPARRPKPVVDIGRPEPRPKDRYPEDYDANGEDRSRRHYDIGGHRDTREDDREKRRREDAVRDVRADVPPRDRRDEAPRERRDDGHRERRDDGPREKPPHSDQGLNNGLMLGGVAAATAMATEAARSHHRHKDPRDERDTRHDPVREPDRDRLTTVRDPAESTSASTVSRGESEDERRERRRRRRERKEREDREARDLEERERRRVADETALPRNPPASEAMGRTPDPPRESFQREPVLREPERRRDIEELAPPRGNTVREQRSYERHSDDGRTAAVEAPKPQTHGHHRHHSSKQDYESYSDSDSSISDASSRRPRNVHVVTPTEERAPSPPPAPKSILRAPREKFPEDPAPVREGVAPLKDAGKKGIPPNARWTKIDRKLVNPEALEAGKERYEERLDYVIVLRVLTKEEIEQYAAKTQELRAQRATAPPALQLPPPPPPGKVGRPEQGGVP